MDKNGPVLHESTTGATAVQEKEGFEGKESLKKS